MNSVTVNAQFAGNPAFLEYQDLLIQIQHALCRGDNQTANRLCDASEDLAPSLSLAEVQWLQWLSSDLEMLCGGELLQPSDQSYDEYNHDLSEAWLHMQEDPEKILFLLRKEHNRMPLDRIAYARARAYGTLGYKNLFLEFMRAASQLNPAHMSYKVFLLDEMKSQGRFSEVMALADAVFNDPLSSPFLVFQAAAVVYMFTQTMTADQARPLLGRIRQVVQRVFNQYSSSMEPNLASFGLLVWGAILESLKKKAEAKARYMQAININPEDDAPLLALAVLIFNSKQDEAFSLYEKAVELGSRNALPYLQLALRELNNHNYQHCMDLGEQVLAMINTPKVRAHALELLALSEVEAFGPVARVINRFEEAILLDPDNSRMRENYEEVLKMHNNLSQSQEPQPIELTLREFKADSILSELDVRTRQFLSERLTSISSLSAKDESSILALAA